MDTTLLLFVFIRHTRFNLFYFFFDHVLCSFYFFISNVLCHLTIWFGQSIMSGCKPVDMKCSTPSNRERERERERLLNLSQWYTSHITTVLELPSQSCTSCIFFFLPLVASCVCMCEPLLQIPSYYYLLQQADQTHTFCTKIAFVLHKHTLLFTLAIGHHSSPYPLADHSSITGHLLSFAVIHIIYAIKCTQESCLSFSIIIRLLVSCAIMFSLEVTK